MLGIIAALGGRKQTNGYVAALALTLAAVLLGATYADYALALLTALGVTNGSVALEDLVRARANAAAGQRHQEAPGPVQEADYEILPDQEGR